MKNEGKTSIVLFWIGRAQIARKRTKNWHRKNQHQRQQKYKQHRRQQSPTTHVLCILSECHSLFRTPPGSLRPGAQWGRHFARAHGDRKADLAIGIGSGVSDLRVDRKRGFGGDVDFLRRTKQTILHKVETKQIHLIFYTNRNLTWQKKKKKD